MLVTVKLRLLDEIGKRHHDHAWRIVNLYNDCLLALDFNESYHEESTSVYEGRGGCVCGGGCVCVCVRERMCV